MDPQDGDGLKWFGEGFDGFPKILPDDCVQYEIYVVNSRSATFSAVHSKLNEILKASNELKKRSLIDYIWQRDDFKLSLIPGSDGLDNRASNGNKPRSPVPPHLHGRTNFGDSIADEWLIVYLLLELSKLFEDAWIRVYDTDGEFLLIEAAEKLPKWLNPEIAEHRVWINRGDLKIVRIAAGDEPTSITLFEALAALRDCPQTLLNDPAIQSAAFRRLEDYPAAISKTFHNSRTTLPRRIAWLLHRNPSYIAPVVEAFYLRDPISLKPLSSKDLSTLLFPPEDFVTVSVKYTKVGFAQLRGQIFAPPPSWVGIAPRVLRDEKVALGMKVACGMEMLIADPQRQNDKSVREIKLLLEDLEMGEEVLPSNEVIGTWNDVEDDESWLDVDYAAFEKELDGKTPQNQAEEMKGFGDKSAQTNLRKMVSRFERFLDDDDTGAEGVDDMDNDDDVSGSGSDDNDDDSSDPDHGIRQEGHLPESAEHESAPGPTTDESKSEQTERKPQWDSHLASIEFEKAMTDVRGMTEDEIRTNGLLEEARRLALEDREFEQNRDDTESLNDEDDLQEVMALMEKEIQARKARAHENDGAGSSQASAKPFFGPERPPHMLPAKGNKSGISTSPVAPNDDGAGSDEEADVDLPPLSSDEEDYDDIDAPGQEDYNHVDVNLAKNLLEAFKGQAGLPGPAGNLMRAMGMNAMMPRDADDAIDAKR
jgi:hypothetical protein